MPSTARTASTAPAQAAPGPAATSTVEPGRIPRPGVPAPSAPLPLGPHDEALPRSERRLLIAGVAGLHVLALWALLQVDSVQRAVREVSPLVVDFITPEAPPPPPSPPVRPRVPAPRPAPAPVIAVAPTPTPAPASFVVPAPEPVPAPAPAPAAVQAPPAPPAPVPPPPPPAPKLLPATAVRYLVPPPIEVPMASRRLGEAGTVVLRVLVDTAGLPRQITLHKSSGFTRLDEQAISATRKARFVPQMEDGLPIEVIATVTAEYELTQ